jgi:hypothetical protein
MTTYTRKAYNNQTNLNHYRVASITKLESSSSS